VAAEPEPTNDELLAMQQAYEHGQRLLGDARRSKVWRVEDARQFRRLSARVSAEQSDHLQRELARSVNEGALVPDHVGGPP
jgi:hypothetical protein